MARSGPGVPIPSSTLHVATPSTKTGKRTRLGIARIVPFVPFTDGVRRESAYARRRFSVQASRLAHRGFDACGSALRWWGCAGSDRCTQAKSAAGPCARARQGGREECEGRFKGQNHHRASGEGRAGARRKLVPSRARPTRSPCGRRSSDAARRARREAQAGAAAAVGGIVPWPMPPALIIRHTRDVHDDIGAFLFGLRY